MNSDQAWGGLFGNRLLRVMLLTLALIIQPVAMGTVMGAENNLELTVKSAYIYNFLQFIDWQEQENDATSRPIRICVIGNDPIGKALGELTSRQVKGRSIRVEQIVSDSDVSAGCHVVVIGRSEEKKLSVILKRMPGTNVLTVSDIPQFARKGGGIGFVIDQGRVKLEINLRVTQQAGLRVSAKLLEVARILQ